MTFHESESSIISTVRTRQIGSELSTNREENVDLLVVCAVMRPEYKAAHAARLREHCSDSAAIWHGYQFWAYMSPCENF